MNQESVEVTVLPPEAVEVLTTNEIGDTGITAITKSFVSLFAEAKKWEADARAIVVKSIADVAGMKKARELRLRLKDIRTTAEKKRKELKEDSLRTGKAIDGIANVLKALIEPLEERLEEQEKFIEREQERIKEELRRKRQSAIIPFSEIAGYTENMDLALLSDKDFSDMLLSLQSQMDAKKKAEADAEAERVAQEKARIEAEEKRKQEEKRVLAELEKEKAQRAIAEKARLDAEAKMEAERKAQRAIAEKARLDAEAKMEAERKAQRAIAEKERAEAEKLRAEEEKKRLEAEAKLAEIKAKEDAEKKRIADAEKSAKKAPDKEKLVLFCGEISKLIEKLPDCKTVEGKKAENDIREKTLAFANWVKRVAETI